MSKKYDFNINDIKENLDTKYQPVIDEELEIIKVYIETKCKKLEPISFKWELSDYFNAYSKKIKNNKFIIVISYAIPYLLEQNIIDICNVKEEDAKQIITLILKLILWHEFMHIAFGHCTISINSNIPNDHKKKFEVMCDLKGLDNMFCSFDVPLMHVIKKNNNSEIIKMKEQRILWYSSLITSLFIYHHITENKELLSDYLPLGTNRDHPFSTFRFELFLQLIERHLTQENGSVPPCAESELIKIYQQSNEQLKHFGFEDDKFTINPLQGKYYDELKELTDIDYDKMKEYVSNCYLNE
jgi:hypothetical protein